MKRLTLFLSCICLSLCVLAGPEIKGSPQELKGFLYPNDKIVTISAEAQKTAYSDIALVSLVVTTESRLLSDAIASNSKLRTTISRTLIDSGVDPVMIKSSKFSSSPQYGWFGKKPSSFKVVNRMAVTIAKESHLEDIATVADQFENVELSDTEFKHSKQDAFREEVKSKALDKILKQKAVYEKSLGVSLKTVGIRDSNLQRAATRGATMLEEVVVSSARSEQDGFGSSIKYSSPKPRSSFDEVKYQVNLSVDFKIVD
jgi:uncharacterized protein YggE